MTDRRFRFGLVTGQPSPASRWAGLARRAEDLGFDTLLVPDAAGVQASVPALAAVAASSSRLRIGTFVLAAPMHSPGRIAWETATLDQLSEGRFELGLGAGRGDAGGTAELLGVPFGSAGERVRQVGEAIQAVRKLFADGTFTPVQQPAPPIMVAGSGTRLLRLAAQEADIVAVHTSSEEELRERLPVLREAAGARFDELELSVNVFAIGDGPLPEWMRQFGIDPATARDNTNPAVLTGDTATVVDTLRRRRDELGLSYVTVNAHALEAAIPVVERLAGT
ncbi:TIGR03621 family F420-dependent LLM class oxidoreductase [Amycolatopsis sp. ATCC 39116]|uniref:TIGR03621 family F420-dependent LLM class oxidoreductase n=1 Tax=Amycolatopsis sp. (strain ATCC 39116 / 75iv2) TaxID=385957 RepID=UPI0002628CE8|nr:TIGR03621 family F420-dependent LLM class oxidoreductase [Amycolatopsis sp. ATCC 39116]